MPPILPHYPVLNVIYCLPVIMIVAFTWMAVAGLINIRMYFVKRREVALLNSRGELLQGVLVSAQGTLIGKARNQLDLEIVYQFLSPDGVEITKKQKARRNGLIGQPMPAAGTPVTVLYVDQQINCVL